MKTCGKCNKTKSESQFHKNRQLLGGLHTYCKSCRLSERSDHYQKNRTQELERVKEKRHTNRDRFSARETVNLQVKFGNIPPISTQLCAICGSQANDYHHESYKEENWLDVTPLCRSCHRDLHCGNINLPREAVR